jgi:DNA invertase Pin-like site-specific DNA recombinase
MNRADEFRILPQHLERDAVVYVRQSTADQVRSCTESTRVQLGLRERAIALGWKSPVVIDEDLGISAAGFADRPGFQNLMSRVARRQVGIIFCIDASRLSRNSRDWAHLFELCGCFETLIADIDQIYNLQLPNDRLVLGIKGTVSELELSILKNRMRTGLEAKAARGELKTLVPPGYVYDSAGCLVLDPDRSVVAAIRLLFDQFDRLLSVRQLTLWYRDTHTLFPVRKLLGNDPIRWQVPTSSTLGKLLLNPIYAGAYCFGRHLTRVEWVDGSLVKRKTRQPPQQARVLLHDHHAAYISWEQFLSNGEKIAQNRARWHMRDNRGALRDGLALLAGLLRCGHCGDRIRVAYKDTMALYHCDAGSPKGTHRCLAFGSKAIDLKVSDEICRALSPLAIEAAALAEDDILRQQEGEIENARLRVQAAQYEADRAFDQFDAVDPKNRLVADSLEQRLNDRLLQLEQAKRHLDTVQSERCPLSDEQRRQLTALAADFPALWDHPAAQPKLRKQILRTILHEIIVFHRPEQQQLEVLLHWVGGAHTRVFVPKRHAPRARKTDPSLIQLVEQLAGGAVSDTDIARVLNLKRIQTPTGLNWIESRVRDFRNHHRIRTAIPDQNADYVTGLQAMRHLGVSRNALLALIRRGVLTQHQVTDFAPWRIAKSELDSPRVGQLVAFLRTNGRFPEGGSPANQRRLFDQNKEVTPEL